ncbi:DNA-3-methyladenine glycosylase I [Persicitalea jodogahamensis]|uniref:DNA-3-methyladenine glycosylase n=1 Tax=Persicitalea jodogahamensis TaxID=402147 RepID=A0A8J3GA26_9BACT|nr:DNA-3-methyladenine glycosylase I [Persicitalea jodogahamensis]GHB67736.1 DNA-3-methyladenine glycosylase [Persicitalea jodogahamensis]
MTYCDFVNNNSAGTTDALLHKQYHDHEYGFPLEDDDALFGRLLLEINQAGLSWTLMLRKQENFRLAYDNFSIEKVANYGEEDVQRLLGDAGIIRNRLKINAAVFNARRILELKEEFGTFKTWLDKQAPLTKADWVKLFRKNFRFVGGEIVGSFLLSTGYLPDAHDPDCPVFLKTEQRKSRPE